jgi:radical SAM superfamily enzyme YgiQ (UPF0313 family)
MKIALIAMSGIRACDTELLELGLTLPGFVERSRTIASLPSLGLLTLAGMTPPEHEVTYIEISDIREMEELPAGFDLVAISSFSAQINEAYELGDRYRAAGVPTVIGGLHVSMLPDEAALHCDAVVVGEGEPVWLQVVEDAGKRTLKPRYGSLDGTFDLADAPMPAFHLLDLAKYNRLTVQTSRGCPHRCEFCASSILLTRRYKQKPIPKVLAEIDRIQSLWQRPFIEFADDNSFIDRRYWRQLLPHLTGRRLRWFTETDIGIADDPALLDLMRESGCAQVLIGLESPVDEGMRGLEMKSDWKRRKLPDYIDAIRRIQSHGITVNGCFIIGLDGHTPRIFDDVFDFVEKSGLYEVQVTILTPFPGTPLYARFEKEGRLLEPGNWMKCTLFDINYQPAGMTPAQLHDGFLGLVRRLYCDEFTSRRRAAFRKQHKQSLSLQQEKEPR